VTIKHAIVLTGLVTAAAVSPLSVAQDSGWYLGASAGQSKAKDACPDQIPVGLSCDDTSGAYSVFGGYQVNKYLGAEFGYTYLGEIKVSAPGISETDKAWGFELLGVGTIPINPQFEVYGKAGVFFWDYEADCTGASCPLSSLSETGTDFTYALGAKFNFTRNVGVRVQYQRYKDIGVDTTIGGVSVNAKSDVDVISVGVVFKF